MKRLIIMLVIFSLMLGFAIFELVYTRNFYSMELRLLNAVEEKFDENPEQIFRPEVVAAFDDAFDNWEKGKNSILMLINHNSAKLIDEKMVALKELILMNQQYDAYVALKTSIVYIANLRNDILPLPANLL